jgi:four helix bundle protein
MVVKTFEELKVWQNARGFVKHIYEVTEQKGFAKDFALRDQIRRSAISVMSNIAEGFESSSNAEFIRFLSYAKSSSGEARSQLYTALDLNYMLEETFEELRKDAMAVSRQLVALMKYLGESRQRKRT